MRHNRIPLTAQVILEAWSVCNAAHLLCSMIMGRLAELCPTIFGGNHSLPLCCTDIHIKTISLSWGPCRQPIGKLRLDELPFVVEQLCAGHTAPPFIAQHIL
jgi:hypothetical protein